MENQIKGTKIFHRIIIFMIGIILSIAGTAMLISGTFNLDKFYDVGQVYDVASSTLKAHSGYLIYSYTDDCFIIQNEVSSKGEVLGDKHEEEWNYIIMELSHMSTPSISGRVDYYNNESELVYQQDVLFVTGENIIVSEEIKYSQIIINFFGNIGDTFKIDTLQFREQKPVFTWKAAVMYFVIILCVYYMIILLGKYVIKKKRVHRPINTFLCTLLGGLQLLYMKVGSYGESLCGSRSESVRSKCRIACIMFMFFYMQIISYNNMYFSEKYIRYHMYVCTIAIFVLAFFCWEKPLQLLDWNQRFVKIWLVFWLIAMVSEFLVPKRYLYQGIIMLFFMGFFYFMWNNMRDKEEILRNFRKALEIWFWINIPYCYLFEPYMGVRYQGASKNPNEWAMYLIFVLAAFLSEVELDGENIRGKKLVKNIVYFATIGIIWDFILKTGSSSGLIPSLLMQGLYIFRQVKKLINKNNRRCLGRYCGYLLVGGTIVLIMTQLNDLALREISFGLGITEEAETISEAAIEDGSFGVMVAEAAGIEALKDNRVIKKLLYSASLEEFTTGRNLYWAGYLRELNLWGNEANPIMWNTRRTAHNGLIAIMHRYGIFSSIPYVFMIGYYLWYSLNYKETVNRKTKMDYFILSIAGSVGILLLMENVEYPFYYINWYNLYLIMGIYFGNKPRQQQTQMLNSMKEV